MLMDSHTVALFFALMLLGGAVGLAVAATNQGSRAAVTEMALPLAAMVAMGATAGSLYFSEIAGLVPCKLCWFQRIAMYPLGVILPVAAMRRDVAVMRYVRLLAVPGLLIALYHSQLQAFPDQGSFCELTNPCTTSLVKTLRWITIPHMSALSFAAVALFATLARVDIPGKDTPNEQSVKPQATKPGTS